MTDDTDTVTEGLLVFAQNNNQNNKFGFLRLASNSYAPGTDDVYVSGDLINQYQLRPADRISGHWRPPGGGNQRFRGLTDIISINRQPPDEAHDRPFFDDLTPIYPNQQLKLEHASSSISARVVDLITPIGRGQRAMIVAPPRTGKTQLLQHIGLGIQNNYKDVVLIVLLIDERPEEVTDMREVLGKDGKVQVIASTFDEQPERHIEVAEVVMERACRLAEMKAHVVVLLDSITRLARAYNTVIPPSGRVMSGGLDARALPYAKKIFGAARNLANSGSITIIGTALVDTGSKMDDIIFEEFKGTGNSEIHLDRRLMEKRIFPCIDMNKSGTRREELLLDPAVKQTMDSARSVAFSRGGSVENMEILVDYIKKTKNNNDLMSMLGSGKKA